jgi:high affinity Mn2+ porin
VGLAGIVSGASSQNQKFLEAGGTGILDGDGALTYGPEYVMETYYNHKLSSNINGTLDYQYITNPAFNQDRGPASVYSIRLHTEF